MKNLHNAMRGIALAAVLAVSLGFAYPSTPVAEAQHGHGMGMQEQFDAFSSHLELTDHQIEAVAAPFQEGLAALENLHRLHGLIMAELSEEQQQQYTEMVQDMVGSSFTGQSHDH
jgi:hypothetical protein